MMKKESRMVDQMRRNLQEYEYRIKNIALQLYPLWSSPSSHSINSILQRQELKKKDIKSLRSDTQEPHHDPELIARQWGRHSIPSRRYILDRLMAVNHKSVS